MKKNTFVRFPRHFSRRFLPLLLSFLILLSLLAFPLTFLVSCQKNTKISPRALVSKMAECDRELPATLLYTVDSEIGAPDYLSKEMLETMYGNGSYPEVFDRLSGAAVKLSSFTKAREFAVFLCKSQNDTAEIAELCILRIESIKYLANSHAEKNNFGSLKINDENARVIIVGKYVIMAVSPYAKEALECAKAILS